MYMSNSTSERLDSLWVRLRATHPVVYLALILSGILVQPVWSNPPSPGSERSKGGAVSLRAFASVVKATRDSVVRLDLDGKPAALGAVIDTNGLVITKATELGTGKLTCTQANGTSSDAHLVATDDDNDLALVRVSAHGLKPIRWASQDVAVGQWAITPGIDLLPAAVGIVSVPPRKIAPKRVYLGVQLDFTASSARIAQILPGLGAEQ